MLLKSIVPILFILFIQTNVSKCFLPIYVDFQHGANLFDGFRSHFDILPQIAERFFVQSFFMTEDAEEPEQLDQFEQLEQSEEQEQLEQPELFEEPIDQKEDQDYVDSMLKLEEKLNQDQENFIHKFILNDDENFDEKTKSATTTRKALSQETAFIFIELGKNIDKRSAEDLLKYISQISQIPLDAFKNLNINENLLTFKVNNASTSFLVNRIRELKNKIFRFSFF